MPRDSRPHSSDSHPDEASLLAAFGLTGATESPFEHTGFSGATLTRLQRGDGASFVLKRTSIERDWIMRATADFDCRECAIDDSELPVGIRSPLLGYTLRGGCTILMLDIGQHLLPQGTIAERQLDVVLQRTAELHAAPPPADGPWCNLSRRLLLLSPETAKVANAYGAPVARDLVEGWRRFEKLAPRSVVRMIAELHADPTPLLLVLAAQPPVFLHGDLKLDNIGIDADGGLWLIDWAMTMRGAAALEMGWFLAINSRRLPMPLDNVMAAYARHSGVADDVLALHDALTVLCGLALRGWRKALDADAGEPDELTWWCDRAEAAARFLR